MRYLGYRILGRAARDGELGAAASVAKLYWSEYHVRPYGAGLDIEGLDGLVAAGTRATASSTHRRPRSAELVRLVARHIPQRPRRHDLRRHRYHQILDKGEGDKRTLAQKNIAVLEKRKEKYAEIRSYLSSARGQLELIENTFRLLADQIVTMRSPTELSGQLDDLLDGVEAVRQTTRETDKLLQAVER